MARVTVEDCVTIIPNRFELVLLASQRARDISAGVDLTVDRDNDKNAVIALREVAEQTIDFEELRRHIVHGVNRHADLNFEDDNIAALTDEAISELTSAEGVTEVAFEGEGAEEEEVELSPEESEEEALDAAAAEALASLENMGDSFATEEDEDLSA